MGFIKHSIILLIAVLIFNKIVMADFAKLADDAGFVYELNQDIYVSKINAKQRYFGYRKLFDFLSPLGGMVIDAEPIIFYYAGQTYMIEMWKGQYLAAIGAEIGIYQWNGMMWDAVPDEGMLLMAYTLKQNGRKVLERREVHWWLASFMPGVFSEPSDLVLENIYIEFKTSEMRDAFLDGLYALGYDNVRDGIRAPLNSDSITFNFTSPKSPQHLPPHEHRYLQEQNHWAVEKINKKKAEIGRYDNSPETMDEIIRTLP